LRTRGLPGSLRWRWVTPCRGHLQWCATDASEGSPLRGRHLRRSRSFIVHWTTSFLGVSIGGRPQPARLRGPPKPRESRHAARRHRGWKATSSRAGGGNRSNTGAPVPHSRTAEGLGGAAPAAGARGGRAAPVARGRRSPPSGRTARRSRRGGRADGGWVAPGDRRSRRRGRPGGHRRPAATRAAAVIPERARTW
jgi:hypothetical protein